MATTSISRRSRLAGLLSKAGAIRGPGALNAASRRDLQRVLQADYVRSLRKLLRYEQVNALVDRAAGVWPDFNKRPLRVANIKRLRAMLEALGISLRAGQLSGDQSDKLAGFYLSENLTDSRRPLIYLNTAFHPLAVASALCHELGHHLASSVLDAPQKKRFSHAIGFAPHLNDSHELAADLIVSLAAYPGRTARRLFPAPRTESLVARTGPLTPEVLTRIEAYLETNYGYRPTGLEYAAGLIHYVKLRWAVLAEYEL